MRRLDDEMRQELDERRDPIEAHAEALLRAAVLGPELSDDKLGEFW